jgi:hypothetical protein
MWLGIGVKIVNWWRSLAAANGPFSNHATLTNNLVSYWKLDETSGVRYDSVTTSANDLTDNNTVGVSLAGPSGTVAQFTAANSESLTGSSLTLGAEASIATWVKISSFTNYMLLFGTSDGTNRGMELYAGATSNNINAVQHNSGVGEFGATLNNNITDTWMFLVATYSQSGDNKVHLWKDGVDVAQSLAVTGTPGHIGPLGMGNWAFGASTQNNGPSGVWTRSLSAADITSLFNSGIGKSYSALTTAEKVSLVSYWNLDEVSGTRADSHGANTLTDNNTVTSVVNAGGAMRNAAASFVAANSEYLSTTHDFTLDTAGSLTWASWVKHTTLDASGLVLLGTNSTTYYIAVVKVGNRYFRVILSDLTEITFDNNTPSASLWADTNWHFVVLGFDSAMRKAFMQVDGGTIEYSSAAAGVSTTLKSYAGFGIPYLGNYYPTALYDETAIWSRVLTAQERTDLWNSGAGLFY